MIDDSASMGLEDRYPDDRTNELVDRLVREARTKRPKRGSALTQSILTRNDGQFLREVARRITSCRLYRFSDTADRGSAPAISSAPTTSRN